MPYLNEVALVDVHFEELIREARIVLGGKGIDLRKYIQPASLDVPITSLCYLIKDKLLPFETTIRNILHDVVQEVELPSLEDEQPHAPILFKGNTYLAFCGRVHLPSDMRASLSPKSSIGRIDVMVRGIVDHCGFYDTIDKSDLASELWMEISPRSFNIRPRAGISLSQMMVFQTVGQSNTAHVSPVMQLNHQLCYSRCGEQLPRKLHNTTMIVSLHVPDGEDIGFEALPTNEIIDLATSNSLPPHRFFRPLTPTSDMKVDPKTRKRKSAKQSITLEKDKFYILATKERISIPHFLSAEMVPFSHHIGELRAHYAGFFDPGFGYSTDDTSMKGTVGVLEVRPHETIQVYDGQPIALMEFYENKTDPNIPYGHAGNHYQHQKGPQLSKYFFIEN